MPYKNPEELKAYQKEYRSRPEVLATRLERRDKELQQCKIYREANPEKVKAGISKWQKTAKGKYRSQASKAATRGIEWQLTFEQWWNWWQQTGRWSERGATIGKYCMCRYGDIGPYSLDNIYLDLHRENVKTGLARRWAS